MNDRAVAVAAVAVAAGAWLRLSPPLAVTIVIAALAAMTAPRSTVLLACGLVLVSGTLAERAWSGLEPRYGAGEVVRGVATLVADPERVPGGVRVDVRLDGARLRAIARGAQASSLRAANAGERFTVSGRYNAFDRETKARLASRHLAGRVAIRSAQPLDKGTAWWRVTNIVRRLLVDGTDSFPADRRALFLGVVLGDDRDQDVVEVEDFRAAGLTHLLAVSGQNVAFVLALLAPAMRRLSLRGRLVGAAFVLAAFGTVTRWEPSVTRACAMALVTLIAATLGRPVSAVRVLALAATALVLVDPLLVHSIGFGLSVAACAGIAVIGPRLRNRMPEAVAVTLAAQAATTPMLMAVFGPVPLAAVPANVVAAPLAAPLMMWGAAGGLVAGVVGEPFATVLHMPTRVMLWGLSTLARVAAGLPLPWLTLRVAITVAGVLAGALVVRARMPTVVGLIAGVMVVLVIVPAVAPAAMDGASLTAAGSDRVWRTRSAVVVVSDGRSPPGQLLGRLRARGIRRIDVAILTSASPTAAASFRPVPSRIPTAMLLAPPNHQLANAIAVEVRAQVRVGDLLLTVAPEGVERPRLRVRIGSTR